MDISNRKLQWLQLSALSFSHIVIDFFPGALHVVMPAFQKTFGFSIAVGIGLLAIFNLSCNFIQVMVGHFRQHKTTPLLLCLGLIFVPTVCLVVFLPKQPGSWIIMVPFILVSAGSIAVTHPESLRALHRFDSIRPSLVSAVYMNSGFLGFAVGGYIASAMISAFGLKGLLALIILPVTGLIAVTLTKVRLPLETDFTKLSSNHKVINLPFAFIMFMAIPFTTATVILSAFLPQHISRLDMELTYGGLVVLIFISGSATGTFFWASIANKIGELVTAVIALLLGIPFLYTYLFMIENKIALIALLIGGFGSGAAFSLIVTLARFARGLNLGSRMGLVVGGAWGIASGILMILGPVAERYGTTPILMVAPMFYLFSAVIGINLLMIYKRMSNAQL